MSTGYCRLSCLPSLLVAAPTQALSASVQRCTVGSKDSLLSPCMVKTQTCLKNVRSESQRLCSARVDPLGALLYMPHVSSPEIF